ncbi:MAG TPA: RsmG family class I SAM-dependent methyltransferase [Acidimicrobiia bacterium]|nr:RsmG family class I SAM-dependent methyltransferase [Acidimicrobiia bacterium]
MKHVPNDDVSRETISLGRQGVARLDRRALDPLLARLGVRFSEEQRSVLDRFAAWLCTEAVAAGAIGPSEVPRIFDRHIADSLVYLAGLESGVRSTGVTSIVDVGSGVGLPGIPLAIARPSCHVTLVDRSSKRSELSQRVVRILGLENVEVRTAEANRIADRFEGVVFRASLPVVGATAAFLTLGSLDSVGVFGLSRRHERPEVPVAPDGVAYHLSCEGDGVLDSPAWLLRMQRTHT